MLSRARSCSDPFWYYWKWRTCTTATTAMMSGMQIQRINMVVCWLPRRVLHSTRGYCEGRYCSLQYRQYRKPFWVLHSTRSRYGYCAVPAVPTGTAVLQLVLWVLCSTRLVTVLHSTAVLQAGTAPVHQKDRGARYLFGNTYRTTPGLNLELPVCMGMQ